MKSKLFALSVFPLLLIFFSCNNDVRVKNEDCKYIPVDVEQKRIDFNEYYQLFIDDLDIVSLELLPGAEIRSVIDFSIADNKIFIQQDHQNPLLVFSMDGKYLYSIGKIGKGAGEIELIKYFFIEDTTLYILSWSSIYTFDLKGNLLDEQVLLKHFKMNKPFYPDQFYKYNNTYFFYDVGRETSHSLYIFNEDGKYIGEELPINYFPIGLFSRFIKSDDNVYLLPPNCQYVIYRLADESIIPAYCFDFGAHGIQPNEDLPATRDNADELFEYCYYKKKVDFINAFNDIGNYLLYDFVFMNKRICGLYMKDKQKNYLLKSNEINLFDPVGNSNFCKTYNERIICFVDAYIVVDAIEKGNIECKFLPDQKVNDIIGVLKNLKYTDNPVMFSIKIK